MGHLNSITAIVRKMQLSLFFICLFQTTFLQHEGYYARNMKMYALFFHHLHLYTGTPALGFMNILIYVEGYQFYILVITVAHNPLRATRVPVYTNQCKHS